MKWLIQDCTIVVQMKAAIIVKSKFITKCFLICVHKAKILWQRFWYWQRILETILFKDWSRGKKKRKLKMIGIKDKIWSFKVSLLFSLWGSQIFYSTNISINRGAGKSQFSGKAIFERLDSLLNSQSPFVYCCAVSVTLLHKPEWQWDMNQRWLDWWLFQKHWWKSAVSQYKWTFLVTDSISWATTNSVNIFSLFWNVFIHFMSIFLFLFDFRSISSFDFVFIMIYLI